MTTAGGTHAIRAAVRVLQPELARAVANDLWLPPDAFGWEALFQELEAGQASPAMVDLLRRVTALPGYGFRAICLLAEAGDESVETDIDTYLERGTTDLRLSVVRALGGSNNPDWLPELARQRISPEPQLQAASLVAMARLGHPQAELRLQTALVEAGGDLRVALIDELRRAAHDPNVVGYLESIEPLLDGEDRIAVVSTLVERGVVTARDLARQYLREGVAGEHAPALVRGLARSSLREDVELLRSLFPAETGLELNIELASALIRQRDRSVLPLLRAAVWREPWNRSILACALLRHVIGSYGLEYELETSPPGATARDLRRVGYALGALDGLDVVESLTKRRRSGDPALQGAYLGALAERTR
jgi:hypothetical protein